LNTGICVMVELLLSKGADVNILSCCGTPLHVAAMENQGAVMKILLDNNADVSFFSFDVFGVL
jgi:ankyrin repeat protein